MISRKPEWLRSKMGFSHKTASGTAGETARQVALKTARETARETARVRGLLRRLSLSTICDEAACPNRAECFGRGTATFMILGRVCTRNCTFCNVTTGRPTPLDPGEPAQIRQAVQELGLRHVVITSVTRDDLADGGAGHYARVIRELRSLDVIVEVLIPDFQGSALALTQVAEAGPHVINHNLETVPRLYPTVRPQAIYERSLELLDRTKQLAPGIISKSGLMLGLGETRDELTQVLHDLRKVGCEMLTIGQYLAPSRHHHPVVEYVHPSVFDALRREGGELGFSHVASAPLVRSSYHAERSKNALHPDPIVAQPEMDCQPTSFQ